MKKLCFFIILSTFLSLSCYAQQWSPEGSRSAAMGYTSVANIDFWSVNNNQAGMAFYDKNSAGIYYENRFMLKELSYQAFSTCYTTKLGTLGATINYTGDKNYNTLKAGLGYALKINRKFSFGVQMDYLRTSLADIYKNSNKVTFEIGLLYKPSENISFGMHTFNPLPIKLAEYADERIPTIVNMGFSYQINSDIVVNIEAYKHSEFPLEVRSGGEYHINKIFAARLGICTKPFRYTFGVGAEIKKLNVDFSSCMHQTLGYSPQISLYYSF